MLRWTVWYPLGTLVLIYGRDMQCSYVGKGRRCRRQAAPGSQMCLYHVAWFKGPDAPDAWADRVDREARRVVREARAIEGLDSEVALLRLMIRNDVAQGRNDSARRSIGVLARTLLLQAKLRAVERDSSGQASRAVWPFSRSLEAVLEELGAELDD